MLYVFHVDVGQMMTFEMNLALENVKFLKDSIERHHCIPASSIVLLVSGGEILQDNIRVCAYNGGTDSNPIYMFSTTVTDLKRQPSIIFDSDGDLKKQVDVCLELPAAFSTVTARTQLAQQIFDMGKDEIKLCEKLVHEQHLQQQGWAAVMANMEDLTEEFKERCDDFIRYFTEHLGRRNEYISFIESFDDDLQKLSNVPILESLLENAESKPFEDLNDIYEDTINLYENKSGRITEEKTMTTQNITQEKQKCLNLLEWISFAESQEAFHKMSENCQKGLDSFDRDVMLKLKCDIEKALNAAKRDDIKEIKGLEDRLYGLEKLMSDAKKTLHAQNELCQSFQQHQKNANARDSSILPDLCESHRNQLVVMINNHNTLRDIRRRCSKAKDELCENLCQRLKFVIHVENKMSELDNSLLFYHTSLRRLQKHLGIIEQIHQAPNMYIMAVNEVVRRRIFSSSFLKWSSELSCRMLTIYNDEVLRRREFSTVFEGHFLNTLFPGMNDLPPSYAIEAPSIFDTSLPLLTNKDLNQLQQIFPELTEKINYEDIDSTINFFSTAICNKFSSEVAITKDGFVSSNEYEKVNAPDPTFIRQRQLVFTSDRSCSPALIRQQQPFHLHETQPPDPLSYATIEASLFDTSLPQSTNKDDQMNLKTNFLSANDLQYNKETNENMKHQLQSLRMAMKSMFNLSNEAVSSIRHQLNLLKGDTLMEKSCITGQLENIQKTLSKIEDSRHEHEELIQQLTVDHELDLNDLKKNMDQKDKELQTTIRDNSILKETMFQDREKIEELHKKMQDMQDVISRLESDKKNAIQEAIEKNEHRHRTEMESLRCRYKLMTSMDRSPSDTSLEKIERPDIIDIVTHEQIVKEIKDNFTKDKELAIQNAIEIEKMKWNNMEISHSTYSHQDENQKNVDEKDENFEKIKGNVVDQTAFCVKLDALEKEKQKLEKELEKRSNCISITSCSKGDIVMIVWNLVYEQYVIVQNAPYLYFLHSESYPGFNLTSPEPNINPKTLHCIGVVTDKDYCHARKDENRYKVSRGTRFYRVKVRPLSPVKESEKCIHNKRKQNQPGKSLQECLSSYSQTQSRDKDTTDAPLEEQKSSHKERNVSVTEEDYMEYNITDAIKSSEQENLPELSTNEML